MDRWYPPAPADLSGGGGGGFCHYADDLSGHPNLLHPSCPDSSDLQDARDSAAVRRVHKADREKLRRERLNEQFLELGKALDPERPKHDKATVLNDAIQMLKDLTAQVSRLKAEHKSLSEESCELTQEKNELREEKAALKSEIDSLSAQYQQRARFLFPWAPMENSFIVGPATAYPFQIPVPISSGPMAIHPSMQPFPFFHNQNPPANLNPHLPYSPFPAPCNHLPEPRPPPNLLLSRDDDKQVSGRRSSDGQKGSCTARSEDFSNIATELQLKTPGSSAPSQSHVTNEKDLPSDCTKEDLLPHRSDGDIEESCCSRCSPTGLPENSSNSTGDGSIADD